MALPALAERLDAATFLACEVQQPDRHEFIAGEIFAMTGGRDAHNTISGNVFALLRTALRGSPCRTFIADMKLRVDAVDGFFYPDVLVTCDSRDKSPEADLAKRHPLLLVEVLSDSTAAYDRGLKFEYYQKLDSLQEYLVIEQNRPHADLFRRNAEGLWVLHPADRGDHVALASLGLTLDMAEIYEDVAFTPPELPATA
ncbi:MAG: hypothetical protein RIR00_833 [Pseudomonadota bacterium]|jgi:Uma2 family endonuclease